MAFQTELFLLVDGLDALRSEFLVLKFGHQGLKVFFEGLCLPDQPINLLMLFLGLTESPLSI